VSVTQRTQHDCAACCIAEVLGVPYEDARAAIACEQLETPGVPAPYPSQIARAVSTATNGEWTGTARPIRTGPAKAGDLVLVAGLGAYPGWHCVILFADGHYYDPADGGRKQLDQAKAMYAIEVREADKASKSEGTKK
jgi:hypothetical protein